MTVTFGFYNSLSGDRKYNSDQISRIFDGIIDDGVYEKIGSHFNVVSTTGMNITVGIGRAWFNHTWTLNDAILPLTVKESNMIFDRIDAVVIEVNRNDSVRENAIKIIEGVASSSPVPPTLSDSNSLYQYPLAYITVKANTNAITQANIQNMVGTSLCPFVIGAVKSVSIDDLIEQWQTQWKEKTGVLEDDWNLFLDQWKNELLNYFETNSAAFNEWFRTLKTTLESNVAGNLQLQIEDNATMINALSEMIATNNYYAPVEIEDNTVLTDDAGNVMIADWHYQITKRED